MIIGTSARPLLEQFQAANEAEGIAIKELLADMQAGGNDNQKLEALTNRMTNTHDKKMDIYAQLQSVRLDK
jgi:hypothetical protein